MLVWKLLSFCRYTLGNHSLLSSYHRLKVQPIQRSCGTYYFVTLFDLFFWNFISVTNRALSYPPLLHQISISTSHPLSTMIYLFVHQNQLFQFVLPTCTYKVNANTRAFNIFNKEKGERTWQYSWEKTYVLRKKLFTEIVKSCQSHPCIMGLQ